MCVCVCVCIIGGVASQKKNEAPSARKQIVPQNYMNLNSVERRHREREERVIKENSEMGESVRGGGGGGGGGGGAGCDGEVQIAGQKRVEMTGSSGGDGGGGGGGGGRGGISGSPLKFEGPKGGGIGQGGESKGESQKENSISRSSARPWPPRERERERERESESESSHRLLDILAGGTGDGQKENAAALSSVLSYYVRPEARQERLSKLGE